MLWIRSPSIRPMQLGALLLLGATACAEHRIPSESAANARDREQIARSEAGQVAPTQTAQSTTNIDLDAVGLELPAHESAAAPGVVAQDTGAKRREADDRGPTPSEQGTSERDRRITQRIREAVVANEDLSFTAKNVKIITANGRVTLSGPVRTDRERLAINAAATDVAGEGQVNDQLEVTH